MKDMIQDDPFFSKVDRTVAQLGLERTRELVGPEAMSIYAKLAINRLKRGGCNPHDSNNHNKSSND